MVFATINCGGYMLRTPYLIKDKIRYKAKQVLDYIYTSIDSGILMVLGFSLFVNVVGVWWGLPGWRGWAPDELLPKEVLSGIFKMFSGGWSDVYPPFHFYVLSVLYSPLYLPLFILKKLGLADVSGAFIENSTTGLFHLVYFFSFLLGRLLSALMGTLSVFIVYLSGREFSCKQEARIAAFIVSILTPFVYYSKITNVEIPYVFWFCLSLLFYIRILKKHELSDYLLFATTAVISICTKDQAYGLYVLTVIHILISKYLFDKREEPRSNFFSSIADRKLGYSAFWSVILFFAIHNVLFNASGFTAHVQNLIGPASYGSGEFLTREDNNWRQHLELLLQTVRNLRFSFTFPVLLVCLSGIVMSCLKASRYGLRKGDSNLLRLSLLVPAISYYVFFISVILYCRTRFLLPICILMSFFGAYFISEFWLGRISKKLPTEVRILPMALVCILLTYMFAHAFSVNVIMINDSRYAAEREMDLNFDESSKVLAVSSIKYVPRPEYRKLDEFQISRKVSQEEIDSGHYDYILLTSAYNVLERFEPSSETYKVVEKLINGDTQYTLFFEKQSQPKWNLLNFEGVDSNMQKINPKISIYVNRRLALKQ